MPRVLRPWGSLPPSGKIASPEALAYGQRLDVIAMPCAPEWHQDGMLEVVGPRAFGYDLDYVPLGGAR